MRHCRWLLCPTPRTDHAHAHVHAGWREAHLPGLEVSSCVLLGLMLSSCPLRRRSITLSWLGDGLGYRACISECPRVNVPGKEEEGGERCREDWSQGRREGSLEESRGTSTPGPSCSWTGQCRGLCVLAGIFFTKCGSCPGALWPRASDLEAGSPNHLPLYGTERAHLAPDHRAPDHRERVEEQDATGQSLSGPPVRTQLSPFRCCSWKSRWAQDECMAPYDDPSL